MEDINIVIPKGVENLQLPDDSLLTFYQNLEKRHFWVTDEINLYSLNLINYIMEWNKEDANIPIEQRKPIKLFFFSPGGDLDVNYAIIDAIELSKTPIIGINIGMCASAAAFIYLSCHQRFMLPHSYFIYHQGSGKLAGTFAEIYAQMEDYQKQVDELAKFMQKYTNYAIEEIEEKIIGEWYVRAEEAIKSKICHKIITTIEELI